ncbi:MAG: hypothetical protein ACOCYG_05525 [Spirochaetota bacterium]
MNRLRPAVLLVPIWLTAVLGGCELLSTEATVVVRVPQVPAAWEAVAGRAVVDLTVTNGEYGIRREVAGLEAGGRVTFRLPKESVSLITATFRVPAGPGGTGSDRAFRSAPVGAVVPHHLWSDVDEGAGVPDAPGDEAGRFGGNATVEPKIEWGAPVAVLRRAASAGLDLSRFNVERFLARCLEVTEGRTWVIAEEPILDVLRDGRFRETAVRPAELHAVELPAPPGFWVPANPDFSPVTAEPSVGADGNAPAALLPGRPVPAGRYGFLQTQTGELLHIYVNTEGEALSLLIPPRL